jgi:hypothetical protein
LLNPHFTTSLPYFIISPLDNVTLTISILQIHLSRFIIRFSLSEQFEIGGGKTGREEEGGVRELRGAPGTGVDAFSGNAPADEGRPAAAAFDGADGQRGSVWERGEAEMDQSAGISRA